MEFSPRFELNRESVNWQLIDNTLAIAPVLDRLLRCTTMNTEQLLLETWRRLPETMRQEVLHFAQFLAERSSLLTSSPKPSPAPNLGDKLQAIRDRIVESDIPLLSRDEIEQEVLDRRGG